MDIKRHDGTKERRIYDSVDDMTEDARRESKNPNTKKLVLHFPKLIIPKKRRPEPSTKEER